MKALHLISPRTFRTVEVPIPGLEKGKADQLLIRTRWVSMCGSDIPFFSGSKRYLNYPFAPGFPIHECVGEVVESTASSFKPGDWTIAIPEGNQALAEFFVARAERSVPLPAELGKAHTSCLIQPLSTVMNAVDRLGDVAGRSVSVIGLGSAGLFFTWLLHRAGAAPIIGIDPCDYRCNLAQEMGASKVHPLRGIEVVHLARHNPSQWDPCDICIEVVGHQMETLNDCFELIRKRGTVVAFGVPDQNIYAVEYETFFRKNAWLMASVTPEWREYLGKARDLFLAHRSELEKWVTHLLPIGEAEKAFTLYERHEEGIIKAVLDATNW